MVIKNYTVSLDEEITEQAKLIFYTKGQKLSPMINEFLKDLVEKSKKEVKNNE